jgi:hypothetical protein
VSAARHPASPPREPRERGVARGHLAPSGEDPAHPANPARPFRGAGSRAGSGGLAAVAAARATVATGARGVPVVMARPFAHRAAVPEASSGRVVRQQRGATTAPKDRTIPPSLLAGCHVIQRERPQPFPGPSRPAPAVLRAAAGHSRAPRGPRGRWSSLRLHRRGPTQLLAYLPQVVRPILTGHAPRGSGADRTSGALRAIDSLACPRSWRTCGRAAHGSISACSGYHAP